MEMNCKVDLLSEKIQQIHVYENVCADIDKLEFVNSIILGDIQDEPTEKIIEISNSFGLSYTKQDFEDCELYGININKLKSEMIEIIVDKINLFDNTKYIYWKIYRYFKLYFPGIKINIPNLTEEEKLCNVKYIKQLRMNEENKQLTQKSYDLGYKICGLYLSYYIKDKRERLEHCENLLNELTNEDEILEVKNYIIKLKNIYKIN